MNVQCLWPVASLDDLFFLIFKKTKFSAICIEENNIQQNLLIEKRFMYAICFCNTEQDKKGLSAVSEASD